MILILPESGLKLPQVEYHHLPETSMIEPIELSSSSKTRTIEWD
jgi:hypothetical protein